MTDLCRSAASNDLVILDGALDNHDGVVQTPLDFRDELFGPTSKDQRARLCLPASFKQIVSLATNLLLFERLALPEVLGANVGTCRLNRTSDSLHDSLQVVDRHSTCAKDVSIGKVLCCQVTDR